MPRRTAKKDVSLEQSTHPKPEKDEPCAICGEPAEFEIMRWAPDTPDHPVGRRIITFVCEHHTGVNAPNPPRTIVPLPQRVRRLRQPVGVQEQFGGGVLDGF